MVTWNIVRPSEGIGRPNSSCTEDTLANFQRLLKVKESRDVFSQRPEDEAADAHLVINGHYSSYEKQLEFIKKIKNKGKKIVIGFSADGRWLAGGGLANPNNGINYTDLLHEVDAIISEVNTNWKVYGRFQNKVIPVSEPLEQFKFVSNKQKDIDILFVGAGGGNHLCYAIEIAHMFLEKNSNYKCIVGTAPQYLSVFSKQNPDLAIEVTGPHNIFTQYLKRTKVLVNIEMKPRGGRAVIWGFYAGIPVVCTSGAFFSKLYPNLTFDRIDLDQIIQLTEHALANSDAIMTQAKELAKPYYFPEWKKTLYKALGLKDE